MEAAAAGARVSLLESSGRLGLRKDLFPYLLSGRCTRGHLWATDADEVGRHGIEVSLGERVRAVDAKSKTAATLPQGRGETRRTYDSIVLATGSASLQEDRRGFSKPGVFVLLGLEEYTSLADSLPNVSRVGVVGRSAPLALIVAQELSKKVNVVLFLPSGALQRLPKGAAKRIVRAAAENDVELVERRADSVAGMRKVEAVLSGDSVYPCEAVAVIPGSAPLLPEVVCEKSSSGGAIVDSSMRTSSGGVLAAGDCAELRLGVGALPMRLRSSALAMGRVAGRNAAGGLAEARLSGLVCFEAFGVEVCSVGVGLEEGRAAGLDLLSVHDPREDDSIQISMVVERRSHKIHGVQAVGRGATSLSDQASMIVSFQLSLEDVAFLESSYLPLSGPDASPLCLTAGRLLDRLRG